MARFRQTEDQEAEDTVETIIGPSVKVEGDFASRGNIIVEGHVSGRIKTSKNLRVGEDAVIQAQVEAANAIIAGSVEGNVAIEDNLEVVSSAKIMGDVSAGRLSIQEGAFFSGSCQMTEAANKEEVDGEEQEEGEETEEAAE